VNIARTTVSTVLSRDTKTNATITLQWTGRNQWKVCKTQVRSKWVTKERWIHSKAPRKMCFLPGVAEVVISFASAIHELQTSFLSLKLIGKYRAKSFNVTVVPNVGYRFILPVCCHHVLACTWPCSRCLTNSMERSFLGKLTGSQLVKKFPSFYGTRRFITAFTSARHLSLS
jgi:hypothetical protein